MHDGQLGFAILEQKAAETAENRAFEEKPQFFYRNRDSWWSETSGGANLELEAAVGRGKLKYGDIEFLGLGVRTRKTNFPSPHTGRAVDCRARGAPDRALLPAR